MSRKMLIDGKPVDFDSLFEDDEPAAAGFGKDSSQQVEFNPSESRPSEPDLSGMSMEDLLKLESSGSLGESPDAVNIRDTGAAMMSIRPGQAIDVEVIAIGAENIMFRGAKPAQHAAPLRGRIEGVVSKDDFSDVEISELQSGAKLQVFVVSASRKGDLISVEASREARGINTGGAGIDALRQAQAEHLPVTGKVTGENKGGYEVALQGAKGFVPFSQMDIGPGRKDSSQYIGQTFQFQVSRVEGRNVVLSRAALLREAQDAERETLLSTLEPGNVLQATVQKLESFGLFVDLGAGVTALVPLSEIAWSRGQMMQNRYTSGDKVAVKVLKVESLRGRPRISASIKQADSDPWDCLPEGIAPGRQISGLVTRLADFGAFVEIAPGIEALLHISEMSAKKRIYRPSEVVQVDQQISIRVLSVDRINKRISVSLKDEAAANRDASDQSVPGREETPTSISIPAKATGGGAIAAALMKASKK